MNGEEIRAYSWGNAQVRLPRDKLANLVKTIYPATTVGDVGASAAAISVCAAARSYVSGYVTSSASLIWAVSDTGKAGACVLRASSSS